MTQPTRETTAGRVYLNLRRKARAEARGTDELLVLYVLERFLYRLSISEFRDRFVLKGGMLLAAFDERRPTRGVDRHAKRLLEVGLQARQVDVRGARKVVEQVEVRPVRVLSARRGAEDAGGGDARASRDRTCPAGTPNA